MSDLERVFLPQSGGAWALCDLLGYEGTRWAMVRLPNGVVRRVKRSRLHFPARIDLGGPLARALRALQKLDYLEMVEHRDLLIAAEEALGEALGLTCTGIESLSGEGLDHEGHQCQVHEWLVRSDAEVAKAL